MKDSDGNECDLTVMCMREPGWAANRIEALTSERDQLRAERLDLLVKVSLLRDYFNIARDALATATNWSAKGASEAEAIYGRRATPATQPAATPTTALLSANSARA